MRWHTVTLPLHGTAVLVIVGIIVPVAIIVAVMLGIMVPVGITVPVVLGMAVPVRVIVGIIVPVIVGIMVAVLVVVGGGVTQPATTLIVPVMNGWGWQKYVYVPGVVNVNWKDWFCWSRPLFQTPLLLVEV